MKWLFKRIKDLTLQEKIKRYTFLKYSELLCVVLCAVVMALIGSLLLFCYLTMPAYSVSLSIPLRNWFLDWLKLFGIGAWLGFYLMYFAHDYWDTDRKLKQAKVDYIKSLTPEIPEAAPAQGSSEKSLNSASKQ